MKISVIVDTTNADEVKDAMKFLATFIGASVSAMPETTSEVDDMFGGYLTSEQMRLRDEIVFKFCKKNNIPVAWNLAGGYQTPIQKVLELHETTLKECIKVYEVSENNK